MRRAIWTILAVCVTLLGGALLALMHDSGFQLKSDDALVFCYTRYGGGYLWRQRGETFHYIAPSGGNEYRRTVVSEPADVWEAFGIRVGRAYTPSGDGPTIWAPYWIVAVLLIALPALWLLQTFVAGLVGRHIARSTRCHECGYDLTGNTTERCPECGEAVLGTALSAQTRPRGILGRTRVLAKRLRQTGVLHALLACLFVAGLWVYSAHHSDVGRFGSYVVALHHGAAVVNWDLDPVLAKVWDSSKLNKHVGPREHPEEQVLPVSLPALDEVLDYMRAIDRQVPEFDVALRRGSVYLPLWILVIIFAIVTIEAWYRGRLRYAPRRMAPATAIDASTRPGVQP